MKRERLDLGGWMAVETSVDHNGRYFIGYAKSTSFYFRCTKGLRSFLKLPAGTATRQLLDDWLDGLAEQDAKRRGDDVDRSAELQATGFGPECHLNESDPNYQTRTVI